MRSVVSGAIGELDGCAPPAAAEQRQHEPPGHGGCRVGTVVAGDEVEAEVDSGGRAGRRQHVLVGDEEHAGVDAHLREPLLEQIRVHPVRRGAAAFKEPSSGEHERPGAD